MVLDPWQRPAAGSDADGLRSAQKLCRDRPDQQVTVLKDKTKAVSGSSAISQFSDPAKMEALVRRFLFRSEIQDLGTGSSPAAIALTLLRR